MKMKKTQGIASKALLSVAGFAAFGLTLTPPSAEAVPAFARQMGMQCSMCHSVAFPAINSFGRAFKASGYTMTGAQKQIKGDGLALPDTLNMSMIAKLRYEDTSGDGNIVWPDEQAFLVGGKVADGVGVLAELAHSGGVAEGTGTGTSSVTVDNTQTTGSQTIDIDINTEVESEVNWSLGLKMLFEAAKFGNTRVSIVPFSTDALGPGYGMELLNTGAQRSQRMIEDRKTYSASQSVGIGSGAATGLTVAVTDPMYFVNLTQFAPAHWTGAENVGLGDLATYARAAVTPRIAGFDTGFGVQYVTGEVNANDGSTVSKHEGYVIDSQVEGKISGHAVAGYLSYGSAKGNVDSPVTTLAKDATTSTNVGLLVGITPTINGYLASRSSKDLGDRNAIGVSYLFRQNIKLELWNTDVNGGDSTTTLQMFAGW